MNTIIVVVVTAAMATLGFFVPTFATPDMPAHINFWGGIGIATAFAAIVLVSLPVELKSLQEERNMK